jgi:hypothetical protein
VKKLLVSSLRFPGPKEKPKPQGDKGDKGSETGQEER